MLQYSMSLGHCLVSWHFLNPCWNPLTIYNTSDTFVNLFWNPYATFDTSDTSDTTVLWTLTDIQELEFDFLIFKKDWSWSNRSRRSLKKIELLLSISEKDRITLVNLWKRSKRLNRSQKTSDLLKKRIFHMFWAVFPLFMPKDWIAPVFNRIASNLF